MNQIFRVLTPEQQATVLERRTRMERRGFGRGWPKAAAVHVEPRAGGQPRAADRRPSCDRRQHAVVLCTVPHRTASYDLKGRSLGGRQ